MQMRVKKKVFQCVICLQDNKGYVYNIDENPCFSENDFARIKCFRIGEDGKPDFSREIEIYGKYLVDSRESDVKLLSSWKY